MKKAKNWLRFFVLRKPLLNGLFSRYFLFCVTHILVAWIFNICLSRCASKPALLADCFRNRCSFAWFLLSPPLQNFCFVGTPRKDLLLISWILDVSLCSRKSCDWNSEWRTWNVIQTDFMAEFDWRWVSTVFTTNTSVKMIILWSAKS